MTNDSARTVTVKVSDNGDGTLKTESSDAAEPVVFVNTYAADGSYEPGAVKVMEGRELKEDEFTFELRDQDGNLLQTAKNAADGTISFSAIAYTTEDVALSPITYTISEAAGEDGTVSYDTHAETILVTLTDNGDGTIAAEADKQAEDIVFTNTCGYQVTVRKTDIADGRDLEGARIQVLDEEGHVVDEWTSDGSGEGHGITDLERGRTYTLREIASPHGYGVTADATFTANEAGKVEFSGHRIYDEEGNSVLLIEDDMFTVSASVIKIWNDDNNRDGIRPLSLKVALIQEAGGIRKAATDRDGKPITATLTTANGWAAARKGLPMVDENLNDISYFWAEEETAAGYTAVSRTDRFGDETRTIGFVTTITNGYGPEKTSVSVRKVWDDGNNAARPETIRVQLYGNGRAVGQPVTLSAANGWNYTWENLDRNDNPAGTTGNAKAIAYTVEELEIPEGYRMTISGNAETGFVITNRLERGRLVIRKSFDVRVPEPEEEREPVLIDIPVTKDWADNNNQDGIRPGSVTVHLYAGGEMVDSAVLSEAGGWTHTFTGLPAYFKGRLIRYSLTEDPVAGYTTHVAGTTIRNIHHPEEVSVTVRKEWNDHNNAAGIRPPSIRVTLSNGTSVLLSEGNGWQATISGLPKKANSVDIRYTWTEQETSGYKTEKRTDGTVTTFTNTLFDIPQPPEGYKKPKTPDVMVAIFEEYRTALGVEVSVNHVGDCFD